VNAAGKLCRKVDDSPFGVTHYLMKQQQKHPWMIAIDECIEFLTWTLMEWNFFLQTKVFSSCFGLTIGIWVPSIHPRTWGNPVYEWRLNIIIIFFWGGGFDNHIYIFFSKKKMQWS
jgi:hypothetical protein